MKPLLLYTMIILSVLLIDLQTSYSQEGLSKKPGSKIKIIYIDPSYGGKEFGLRFAQKKIGKDITLLIAQKLEGLLKDDGFNVYLSRDSDQFMPLVQRPMRAKSIGADIYIAFKLSHRKKDCVRLLVTIPTKKRKPVQNIETKKLSELDSQINEIIKGLKEDEKEEESLYLAAKLVKYLQSDQCVDCIKVQTQHDYILLNNEMPTVIIDFGISEQSHKSPYILNTETQNRILASIAVSIRDYADERYPAPNP